MLRAISILAVIFGLFMANMPKEEISYHNWKEEGIIMETIMTEDVIEEAIITENYIP